MRRPPASGAPILTVCKLVRQFSSLVSQCPTSSLATSSLATSGVATSRVATSSSLRRYNSTTAAEPSIISDAKPSVDDTPVLASAGGVRLYDTAHRMYLDFASIDAPLGHSLPAVVAAVAAQSATQAYHSSPWLCHPLASSLSDRAHRVFDADASMFFDSRSGAASTAVALARRTMAIRGSTQRSVLHVRAPPLTTRGAAAACAKRLGSAWEGGSVFGGASATQREVSGGVMRSDVGGSRSVAIAAPDDMEAVENALSDGEICAVVVEPVQLDAGLVMLREGFLRKVGRACRQAKAVMIVDERRTALGRVGQLLAWQKEDSFQPDMTLLGGGLVSGMFPFSCVLGHGHVGNPDLSLAWKELVDAADGATLSCSPIAAASAIATMDLLGTPAQRALRNGVESGGDMLRQKLRRAVGSVDYDSTPVSVRGVGFLVALSVGIVGDSVAEKISESMAHNGVLTLCERNVIFMLPPVGVSEKDLEKAASVFRNSLERVAGKPSGKRRSRRKRSSSKLECEAQRDSK